MVNIPMLRKVLEWVEEQSQLPWQQREWNQASWHDDERMPDHQLDSDYIGKEGQGSYNDTQCGTTFCIAGYVAYQDGWSFQDGFHVRKGREKSTAQNVAVKVLGLKWSTGIFFLPNDPQEIRKEFERIAGETL